jgi:hypothetical protein
MLLLTKIGFNKIKFNILFMILQSQLPTKVHWKLMTISMKQKVLMYRQLYTFQIKSIFIQELFIVYLTY